jgi:hypothetical protein
MKWYENGIMFEGTPEEFRTLHPEIAGSAPVSAISIFPDNLSGSDETPRQSAGKRHGRPHLHVKAELAGGGERHFKSAAAAFRWYASACPVRKLKSYIQFYDALKAGPVRFADAELVIVGGGR